MPLASLLSYAAVFVLGLVFASVGWKGYINAQKLEALEKVEQAREAERKRNNEIAEKHASDLYQVLDHYRRNPTVVRVLQPASPDGCPKLSDVPSKDIIFTVGGVKRSEPQATP